MKYLTKSLIITLFISTKVFGGGGFTGGSTEITQLMNNAELIAQVATAKKQLDTMINNLKKLSDFKDNSLALINQLTELDQAIQYGQALAYNANNLSEQFENRFSDFSEYASQLTGFNQKNVAERYQNWSRNNLDNINSALKSANLQSKYFKTESQRIREIEHQAKTAEGRDQLLQAGIEVATLQSGQLIRLRQLIASDMQMQANYQASVIDRQAEIDARRIHSNSGDVNDNIEKGETFTTDGIFKK